MEIKKKEKNNILIVSLKGRMDGEYPTEAKKILQPWLEKSPFMILDCRELEYIDSSGLGVFLSCLRRAVALGGDIRIAAPLPAVQMVLELTRTEKVFKIFKTVSRAMILFNTLEKEESIRDGETL